MEFIMSKFDITNEAAARLDLAHSSIVAVDTAVDHISVAPVQLPELQAPDVNAFLKDHGIDTGQDGPIGEIDLGNIGNGPGQGPDGSIPGISGIPNYGGDPSDGGSGSAPIPGIPGDPGNGIPGGDSIFGSKLPDGMSNNSNHNDGPGLTLPGNENFGSGHHDISGLGVPGEFDGGGIRGPGVPGGIGSVGVHGFTSSDFQNGQLTDTPHGGGGGGRHGAVQDTFHDDDGTCVDLFAKGKGGDSAGFSAPYPCNHTAAVDTVDRPSHEQSHEDSALDKAWSAVKGFVSSIFGNDTPDPGKGSQPVDDSGSGHPGTHSNEQPVDDSGSGAHPSTHGAEQPVDDSGSGSGGFHPLTNSTAQPVDDSGTTPGHPGTHLGATGVDVPVATVNGLGASFWDAAAAHIASASTPSASMGDGSVHTAQSVTMGMFEHGALTSAPTSSASIVDHSSADVVATTHSVDAHADVNLSHHFELNLDISHLSAHAL
jgi:hypothetical protein